jgi:hypothetical protein
MTRVVVMLGLVPSIHDFLTIKKDVDGRDKPDHDGEVSIFTELTGGYA